MSDFKSNNFNDTEKDIFKSRKIKEYKNKKFIEKKDLLIREIPLTIFIENYEILTLMRLKRKKQRTDYRIFSSRRNNSEGITN